MNWFRYGTDRQFAINLDNATYIDFNHEDDKATVIFVGDEEPATVKGMDVDRLKAFVTKE